MFAKPGTDKAALEPLHISLDGTWRLLYFSQGKYQITQPDRLKSQGLSSFAATVPGEAP